MSLEKVVTVTVQIEIGCQQLPAADRSQAVAGLGSTAAAYSFIPLTALCRDHPPASLNLDMHTAAPILPPAVRILSSVAFSPSPPPSHCFLQGRFDSDVSLLNV